ncbi:MAG: RNase P subunit p30 family protein [Candidatus Altiarchaeota archaeon]
MNYYDLCIRTSDIGVLNKAASLGWSGVSVVQEMEKAGKSKLPKKIGETEIYNGVLISKDVEKNSRKALDFADLILVSGGDDDINRAASECWEVDILLHPEFNREKDYIDYKNAGLDHVMASFMAERGIALGVDFSQILNSSGRTLVQNIGRIRQNVRIALKYKVPVVLVSGAADIFGLRGPLDFAAIHPLIGVPEHLAKKVVSSFPAYIVQKMNDRNNPNIILKGLEVTDWGKQKPQTKRKYGWY